MHIFLYTFVYAVTLIMWLMLASNVTTALVGAILTILVVNFIVRTR